MGGTSGRSTAMLRVLQFGDSLLPVGSFSFSNGLESAVQLGVVHDLDRSAISFGSWSNRPRRPMASQSLLPSVPPAQATITQIDQVDQAVFNRKLNEEMRTMTVRMGRKLGEMADRVLGPSRSQCVARADQGRT